ncbi:MAG TPA: hypothetical protein GXX15_01985 [Clostridia bacterium]|nr:hypothetical protein [Clostridia bacterium]
MRLITDTHVEEKMKEYQITRKDIEERMYEIFSYIPKSYDFVDTTIDKNDKTYRIQFRVCEINEDFIKIECLELSNYL